MIVKLSQPQLDYLNSLLAHELDFLLQNEHEEDRQEDISFVTHLQKKLEPKKTNKYVWTCEIEIDKLWVADGFDLTPERLHDMVLSDLSFATSREVSTKILQKPDKSRIKKEQGYATQK